MFWLVIPILAFTGCGAAFASRTKDGYEYTSEVFTALSNKHKTLEEAEEQIRHVAKTYCENKGGDFDPVDEKPVWDNITSTPVTTYDDCTSTYYRGVNSCDGNATKDSYVVKDERSDSCWIMHDCKKVSRGFLHGEISGKQRFRCFKK